MVLECSLANFEANFEQNAPGLKKHRQTKCLAGLPYKKIILKFNPIHIVY